MTLIALLIFIAAALLVFALRHQRGPSRPIFVAKSRWKRILDKFI